MEDEVSTDHGLLTYLRTVAENLKTIWARPERSDWRFQSIEEFVLHYGRPYRPQPLPKSITQGEPKQCFCNSMTLVMEKPQLTYVEGFASTHLFPVAHGWTTADGHAAIDPTWGDDVGVEYFGIPFERTFWDSYVERTGYWGILFPELGHQPLADILKNGLPPGAVRVPSAQHR